MAAIHASSGSAALTVAQASQSITVNTHAPASAVYNAGFTVAATAPGGTVTYSSSDGCTNVGATFTMTSGTTSCSVKYDQAGSTNYSAAPQVVETVTAIKASQTITVTTHAPASAANGASFGVAATAPGGSVSYSSRRLMLERRLDLHDDQCLGHLHGHVRPSGRRQLQRRAAGHRIASPQPAAPSRQRPAW